MSETIKKLPFLSFLNNDIEEESGILSEIKPKLFGPTKSKDHYLTPFGAYLMRVKYKLSGKMNQSFDKSNKLIKFRNNIKDYQSKIINLTYTIGNRIIQKPKDSRHNSPIKYTKLRNYIFENQIGDKLPQSLYDDY